MASIRKIEGKAGTSYKITVTTGATSTGKQIRHYKTWRPDKPMTVKQMEKEAKRIAYEFERQIEVGIQADNRQTFEEYARYVISLKERQGNAAATLSGYDLQLRLIVPRIGHIRLCDIRPQLLNNLYQELLQIKKDERATPTVDFNTVLKERGDTQNKFASDCGIHVFTVQKLRQGKAVTRPIAEKVAEHLGRRVNDLFTIGTSEDMYSAGYVQRVHSFISIVLDQAEREMLIPYNPASKATPPPRYRSNPAYLQPDEVHAFLDILEREPIRLRTLFHLLIVTGARRGELLSLKWDEIDYTNNRILIDSCLSYCPGHGKTDGPTKTRRSRYVTIPAETADLLRQYKRWHMEQRILNGDRWQDGNYVFTTDEGAPLTPCNVNWWLSEICKRHGFRHLNPHSFRHTAASIMISSGVDVVTVAKMLGHKNPSMTTDVYSHIIEEAQRNATEAVADVILRKKKA